MYSLHKTPGFFLYTSDTDIQDRIRTNPCGGSVECFVAVKDLRHPSYQNRRKQVEEKIYIGDHYINKSGLLGNWECDKLYLMINLPWHWLCRGLDLVGRRQPDVNDRREARWWLSLSGGQNSLNLPRIPLDPLYYFPFDTPAPVFYSGVLLLLRVLMLIKIYLFLKTERPPSRGGKFKLTTELAIFNEKQPPRAYLTYSDW